ncbi:MAG: hypothetical protein KKG60_03265 [Nanoarchaeota archaeon]|nr:hypothetical protein [Nanoarchaeota archaeon]
MKKKIILDTNFLLSFGKVRIFSELERICHFQYGVYVLDKSFEELKNKKGEKLAKELIKKKNIKIIKTKKEEYVDDILAEIRDKKTIIATNDKDLKRRLQTPIITIRQKKHLMLEERKNVL